MLRTSFDELSSTKLEGFDPKGEKIGQKVNAQFGIELMEVEGGDIASWSISIFATRPNGFAIDNLSRER